MRLAHRHSHLNGEEYLLVERSETWRLIDQVIRRIDAETCRNGGSEAVERGLASYDPAALDTAFEAAFRSLGWTSRRASLPASDEGRGFPSAESSGSFGNLEGRSGDLVKDRVSVDLRFSPATFELPDIFAAPLASFVADEIDVGLVAFPTETLASRMHPHSLPYEKCLEVFRRQPRGFPAVPLVLIGADA